MGSTATQQASAENGSGHLTEVKQPNYTFERHGDEFAYAWSTHAVAIGLDQLREDHGELYAEIRIKGTLPDQPSHIHWGRLNLSSTQSRDRLGVTLQKRVKDVPWALLLEIACTRTAIEYRQDEPTVDLATFECPADDAYLVEPMLPAEEVSIIFGNGGSCKSLLAMAIGVAANAFLELPGGIKPLKQVNVLYLDWEAGRKNQLRRLYALQRGLGLTALPHIHYRRLKRPIWESAPIIRAEVSRLNIGLVIVDSIGYACVPEDISEAATALRAMGAARSLGATTLIIAHVAKGNSESKNRRTPFGSIFFENSARSQWEIRRAENTEFGVVNIGLYHSKVNDGPQEQPIGLRFEFFGSDSENRKIFLQDADIEADPELSQHATLATRLRNLLRKGKMSTKELADETGSATSVVRTTLRRMADVTELDRGSGKISSIWGLKAC